MTQTKDLTSVGLLTVLALIWGTSFILIKKGLVAFSAGEVGSLRVAFASLFVLPIALVKLKGLSSTDYFKLLLSGMVGIFIPSFLFSYAETKIDSSIAGVINSLTPIWTMIIGALFFLQRFRGAAIVGTLIGFGGTLVLIMANAGNAFGGISGYSLYVVLATLLYGANLNLIKYKIPHLPSLTITTVSVMLLGPFALAYLFGFTQFLPTLIRVEGAWKSFGYVAILGLMSTAVATVIFNKLIKTTSPLFSSSVTYLIPIVAVMWGVLDGEHLYLGHYLGMVAIVGGVYLANRKK
ncbi:MAG TPA: DMT family transporter [Cyclobacteriaceae bacterium]|nr:DMT family transporter [Cyclobacteriaceae bacterium]